MERERFVFVAQDAEAAIPHTIDIEGLWNYFYIGYANGVAVGWRYNGESWSRVQLEAGVANYKYLRFRFGNSDDTVHGFMGNVVFGIGEGRFKGEEADVATVMSSFER
jgi:hypothetical protein